MSRLIALSLLVYTACATSEAATTTPATPAKAQPASTGTPTADDLQGLCVASFTRDRTCSAEYIPSLVDTRAKIDVPPGIAERVKTDRAGVIAKAQEEWATDSTDEHIAGHCTQMTSQMAGNMSDDMKALVEGVRACQAKTACAEFVACMAPIEAALMSHAPHAHD